MKKTFDSKLSAEYFIEKYADMVYRIALLQTKNKNDADDVFQEVFLRLVKYIHTIEDEEHGKHWLMRVTVNCAKTHFTTAWRRHTVFYEEEREIEESYEMETNEDKEIIYQAVKELPDKYRVVIHLFYYEELSIAEIAEVLKKKQNTIKSQLARGRELLKEKLKGEF